MRKLSPGLTIIATLVGGVLLGLIGTLIAIPTAAAVQLILEEVTLPEPRAPLRERAPGSGLGDHLVGLLVRA